MYYSRPTDDMNLLSDFVPEERLPVAIVGGILLPISLFMFGWTSFASIPWIVPIIASGIFSSGAFLLFQAGLKYVLLLLMSLYMSLPLPPI